MQGCITIFRSVCIWVPQNEAWGYVEANILVLVVYHTGKNFRSTQLKQNYGPLFLMGFQGKPIIVKLKAVGGWT